MLALEERKGGCLEVGVLNLIDHGRGIVGQGDMGRSETGYKV
jgi:hypothetical protein